MTFNNKNGKSEYVVVVSDKKKVRTVTTEVKKGRIERVKEHKMLGTWFDETGKYGINIKKKKIKLQFMISTAKRIGSNKEVGTMAIETRLKLGESVIIPSILYNAEAFPTYKKTEVDELERIQAKMLTQFLEVPKSTPYYGLLMETGWLTMEARLAYKKLMLFHHIMHSDNSRTIKRIVYVQIEEDRRNTWYDSVKRLIERYELQLNVKE